MPNLERDNPQLEVVQKEIGVDYSKSILELYPFEHAATLDNLKQHDLSPAQQAILFYLAGRGIERKSPIAGVYADSSYPDEFVVPLHIDHHGQGKGICEITAGEPDRIRCSMVLPQFACGDGAISANHTDCYGDIENTWVLWSTDRPVYTSMLNFEAMKIWQTVSNCSHNLVSIVDNMRRPTLSLLE